MTELLGIRAYARTRGVSHVAVLKAIEAGRLKRSVVGQGRTKKLDRHLADQEWQSMTDLDKVRPAALRRGGRPRQEVLPGMEATVALATEEGGAGGLNHAQASAMKVLVDVDLRKLEYRERVGDLVNRAQVQKEAFELGRAVRDKVMAVRERVSGLTAEQREELDRELRQALEGLEAE